MYTNADQFWRKFPEFTVWINNEQQMLIGITEVKPKNSMEKLFPAEFSIDHIREYDSSFHGNIAKKHWPRNTTVCPQIPWSKRSGNENRFPRISLCGNKSE